LFLRRAPRVIGIALGNVGRFETVSDFVGAIENIGAQMPAPTEAPKAESN
jgi:hypothetical protein